MAPQVRRSSTRPGSSNGTPALSRQVPKMPRLPVPPGCSRRRAESAIQVAPATCPANYRSVTLLGSFRDVPDAGAARFYDRLVMAVHAMRVRGEDRAPVCSRHAGSTNDRAGGCHDASCVRMRREVRWPRECTGAAVASPSDGTHTARWADIPTDSPAPLGWLTRSRVR
jgi:hypothetical protein